MHLNNGTTDSMDWNTGTAWGQPKPIGVFQGEPILR